MSDERPACEFCDGTGIEWKDHTSDDAEPCRRCCQMHDIELPLSECSCPAARPDLEGTRPDDWTVTT